jgi:NitT/TauT family transport system ATP-binding protein
MDKLISPQEKDLFYAKGIYKSFMAAGVNSSREVLGGLSITLRSSEVVAIVGPSGIGKSTFLKICAGAMEPDDLVQRGPCLTWREPGKRVVWQPQVCPLVEVSTVIKNVSFGALVSGCSRTIAIQRAESVLSLVGLAENALDYPRTLSVGMRQRVALARTLAAQPDIAFLDEPLSSLDPDLRGRISAGLQRYTESFNAGIVIVTHTIEEAIQFASRVYVFNGRPSRVAMIAAKNSRHIPAAESKEVGSIVIGDSGVLFSAILSALTQSNAL